jgi:hypothetical protein
MKPFKVQLSDDLDIPLLLFIWKWKLLTTAALTERFFSQAKSPISGWSRLTKLEKAGLLAFRTDEKFQKSYWTLTSKGLLAISDNFPPLRDYGFRSEYPAHDALVTAFHLGEWLVSAPQGVHLFSEQQLRRYDFSSYPTWVPTDKLHRPDGYWGMSTQSGILPIALEVELSRKCKSDYEKVAEFYMHQSNIVKVMWLVPTQGLAVLIQNIIASTVSMRAGVHNYVLVSEFKERLWGAQIFLGPDMGKTLSKVLSGLPENGAESGFKSGLSFNTSPLLNTKKTYVKSSSSPTSAKT